jgi:hypothetical protein
LRGGRGVGIGDSPSTKVKRRVRRPLHHPSGGPPPPLSRGRINETRSRDAMCARVMFQASRKTSHKKGGEAPKGAMSWSRATLSDVAIVKCFGRGSARIAARTPSGAPPRARFGESTPRLSSSRASWETSSLRDNASLKGKTWRHRVSPASSPVPVQRAPRRPVIDTGRAVSGAARERGHKPRPRAPHSLHQSAVTGDVPSMSEIHDSSECN